MDQRVSIHPPHTRLCVIATTRLFLWRLTLQSPSGQITYFASADERLTRLQSTCRSQAALLRASSCRSFGEEDAPRCCVMADIPSEKKQSTLMGFFGKPKAGPPPRNTSTAVKPSTTASPASTTLRTPSSVAGTSPAIAASSSQREPPSSPVKASARASSPSRKSLLHGPSEDELTPPPTVAKKAISEIMETDDGDDTAMDGEESPVVSVCRPHQVTGRRSWH